ncbi:uncharacterized protein LOC133900380 [Phragmites australis]|uniref:uncharacterized protein LOC133900380 n=1 Tax=Phragmites australis TaxID=29695 RepID=UPI002D78DBA6|nr:uncharacterized protein LOC133900380 [Phragmites australis]
MRVAGFEPTVEWMPGTAPTHIDDDPEELDAYHSGSLTPGGSPDNAHAQSSSAATSRSSLKKFCTIVQTFNDYKKDLVRSIGFGGMLHLPRIKKLNIKFSMWLMQKVDCQARSIRIDDNRVLQLIPNDVSTVFGIPCGPKDILGPDAFITQEAINFLQSSIGMSDKHPRSLKAVESVLRLEIINTSSKMLVEAFKVAFVVFAMGNVLTPSAKHDYVNVNFWGALSRSEEIYQFNWAAHVLNTLVDAARKVQSDLARKRTVSNISGCHIFLQVLYLDNLELGPLKMSHAKLPRIKEFSFDLLSKMISADSYRQHGCPEPCFGISQLRDPSEVCYKCFGVSRPDTQATRTEAIPSLQDNVAKSPEVQSAQLPTSTMPQLPLPAYSNPLLTDQTELINHIRTHYPKLERSKMADILKRFNARYLNLTVTYKKGVSDLIISLADFILDYISKECGALDALTPAPTCVASGGEPINGPRSSCTKNGTGQQLDQSDTEAESAATPLHKHSRSLDVMPNTWTSSPSSYGIKKQRNYMSAGAATRPLHAGPKLTYQETSTSHFVPAPHKETTELPSTPRRLLKQDCTVAVVNQMCSADEVEDPDGKILFAQRSSEPICKKKLMLGEQARSPWNMGCIHPDNGCVVPQKLASWVYAAADVYLKRNWVIHHSPKYIQLSGEAFRSQLVGSNPMGFELCDILIRRFTQLDADMHANSWKCRWRHFFESDFYSFALAGYDLLNVLSVREQFIGTNVPYNLSACRMMLVPACINQVWCCFSFDMWNKVIYVLDPCGPNPHTTLKRHAA